MTQTAKYILFSFVSVLIVALTAIAIVEYVVDDTTMPRPRAMMRIDRIDSTYTHVDILPLGLLVNNSAVAKESTDSTTGDGSRWLNISYPHYRSTVYCSFVPVSRGNLAQHLDNRRKRISLNAEGREMRSAVFEDSLGRYTAEVFFAGADVPTPLQFITTDSTSFIFTGALYVDGRNNPDSIAPVVDYITDDVMTMLQNLKLPLDK